MFMGLILQCGADRPLEFSCVVGDEVGQLAELGVAPAWLDRVEFRCIGGQPLDVDIRDARGGESFGRRAVNLPGIPTDHQRPSPGTAKLLYKGDDLARANMVVMNRKRRADAQVSGRESHAADDAQAVVAIPRSLDRRLAAGGPSASVYRLQPEACFIDKNNAGSAPLGFF